MQGFCSQIMSSYINNNKNNKHLYWHKIEITIKTGMGKVKNKLIKATGQKNKKTTGLIK